VASQVRAPSRGQRSSPSHPDWRSMHGASGFLPKPAMARRRHGIHLGALSRSAPTGLSATRSTSLPVWSSREKHGSSSLLNLSST